MESEQIQEGNRFHVSRFTFHVLAAIVFFVVTSFFSFQLQTPYSGPDETSQAFFIKQYATTGSLRVAEPLNASVENIVHPRSVNVSNHDLVPGTFIGLIIVYGWIAWFFGLWAIPFLTPFFATLGAVAFYWIARFFFTERVARWSFIFLILHPAWVYYTSRSLFSANVFFLSVLMVGVATVLWNYERCWAWVIAGLFVGLGLMARTTELIWVLGGFFASFFFFRKYISLSHTLYFLFSTTLLFFPILYHQTILYGSPLVTGYAQLGESVLPLASSWRSSSPVIATIAAIILPFGFHPSVIVVHAYEYLILLFWWLTIPAVLGFVIVTRQQKDKRLIHVLAYSLTIFAWLVLYYGSYAFSDSPLPSPTIGTSSVRYWLPIFVVSIPFAVIALQTITMHALRGVAVFVVVGLSIAFTFFLTPESLWPMRQRTIEQRAIAAEVFRIVPKDGVILTERSDKLFFPARKVIHYDANEQPKIERLLVSLLERAPVYYFAEISKTSINYLNSNRLARYGVAWEDGVSIGDFTLYTLKRHSL